MSQMHSIRALSAVFLLMCSSLSVSRAAEAGSSAEDVLATYAQVAHANYEDALQAAQALEVAVNQFVQSPSQERLVAARQAWLQAREWYGQTEAFRFYGGPIDSETGPEGRINAWPLDEAYIDSVQGRADAGIVNNRRTLITRDSLISLNERDGEENIATGWHAIEFLLWGQDLHATGPGQRSADDFVDEKSPNADRRRAYLQAVTGLLVSDLKSLTLAWAPQARNYRQRFEKGGVESLRKVIVGLGSLSRGELAGERMEVALNTQDQEDEHSCFSDNTHRDVVTNAMGIENVWLGRYVRRDGSEIKGASLQVLVAQQDAALSQRLSQQVAQSVNMARNIQAPFDQEIVGQKTAPGRQRIQNTIDSLVAQSKGLVDAARVLGIARLNLVKP